jgi:hypothetical protein
LLGNGSHEDIEDQKEVVLDTSISTTSRGVHSRQFSLSAPHPRVNRSAIENNQSDRRGPVTRSMATTPISRYTVASRTPILGKRAKRKTDNTKKSAKKVKVDSQVMLYMC